MSNVMLDIETLGTIPGSQVIQIGAVRFHMAADMQMDEVLIMNVDRFDPDSASMQINEVTKAWWHDQPQRAKDMLSVPPPIPLKDALQLLNGFVKSNSKIWAKPMSFDFPLIRAAYDRVNVKTAWHYRQEMCARTLYQLLPKPAQVWVNQTTFASLAPGWIEHYALDDAKEQAISVMLAYKWMKENTW